MEEGKKEVDDSLYPSQQNYLLMKYFLRDMNIYFNILTPDTNYK